MSSHKTISFIKSLIRLFGCFTGVMAAATVNTTLAVAFAALAIAEVFGILEEIGDK